MQQRNGPFDNYEFCALVVQVQPLYCDKIDQNKLGNEVILPTKKKKKNRSNIFFDSIKDLESCCLIYIM